jgi:hypothetical protein
MTREELSALFDRVIGSKGILRIPSYWMRKILNDAITYLEVAVSNVKIDVESSVNTSTNPVQSQAVKTYVDTQIKDVNTQIGNINTILDNINGEVK